MPPVAILGAMIVVPVIILMILRVNAALVFLSLCLGNVLVQFVSPDANQFLALFSAHVPRGIDTGNNGIKILLLVLPVLLTIIFMIRTIHGSSKLILNILPAIGVGLLGSLLITPLLSSGLSHNIISSSAWAQIQRSQDLIVGVSGLICLVVRLGKLDR